MAVAVAIGGFVFWPDARAGEKPAGSWTAEASRAAAAADRQAGGELGPAGEPGAEKPASPAVAPEGGETRRKAGGATSSPTPALPAPKPVLQLVNGAGVALYTLSTAEAASAEARHGFKLQSRPAGYMWPKRVPGSQPVYRLAKVGGGGWVVTPSTKERDSLVASGRFKNEGVLGYVVTRREPGMVLISRYRGPKDWRIAMPAPNGDPDALLAAGYKLDGPVGYAYPFTSNT